MNIKDFETLGDYMKSFEKAEEKRAEKGKPLLARLDGKAFHTFTRGLKRPYDQRLSDLMVDTTRILVEETGALLGYTQSDEISLCWYLPENSCSQYLFDGRYQKMISILSSIATGHFRDGLAKGLIEEKRGAKPMFDCRLWQVPTIHDAFLVFQWRELDAIKNSISMAAQSHFSHKQLHKIGSEEKKRMLREIGRPWEDEPEFFRKGSYLKRLKVERELSEEELEMIPVKYRPIGKVKRTSVEIVSFPDMTKITDPETEIFGIDS